jgi:hypothetical protein
MLPLKTRNQWQDSWYKYSLVINRLKVYAKVLMGPEMQMSQLIADETACRILEREMANSGIRYLKQFAEKHLRAGNTNVLMKDPKLAETLRELANEGGQDIV